MRYFIASLIIFILGLFNLFAPLRGGMHYAFNPVQYGLQEMARGIKDWVGFYTNLHSIRAENLELLQQVKNLNADMTLLKEAAEENKILRKQLQISTDDDITRGLVLSKTLGNTQDKTNTSIVLAKGTSDGISVNDLVIQSNYLVGIVKEASLHRSVVELITSPTLSLGVLDLETSTEGISRGQFGTYLRVGRVLPEDPVSVGDLFVTSGRDGLVPPGYIVGEVTSVSEESAEELKDVDLKILLDFDNLGKVFVVPAE